MHTASWDPNFDWTDKNVALIGAGSSGIQVLPQIQPGARRVFHYMRGRTWISPVGYAAEVSGNTNSGTMDSSQSSLLIWTMIANIQQIEYTPEERETFATDPAKYLAYRHQVEGVMNKSQLVTFKNTDAQLKFWDESINFMKEKLKKKPEIFESLLPNFPPGCRRLTPGPGYLEALVEDNVEFIGTGITRCTETGIIDDNGKLSEVDAIICATGFD